MNPPRSGPTAVVSLDAYRASKRKTLLDMERSIEKAKNEAAERAMNELIAELGPEDGSAKPCPRCTRGVPVHSKNVGRTITSLHGTHTLMRNYHYCRACSLGFYPRDAELGLPTDGALSLEMERRVLDFAVSAPYEECAERWRVHYPQASLSSNQFRQVAERVGKRAEDSERRRL